MFVKLFIVAAALIAASLPSVAATGATVQLYADSSCQQAVGEPLNIPLPFSAQCQSVPSSPPVSLMFNCAADGKNTAFVFDMYNGTSDCSGKVTVGITSNDTTGGCAKTQITAEGQTQTAYSHIDCSASSDALFGAKPLGPHEMKETVEDLVDFVSDFHKGAQFKNVKYHDDGTMRHRTKFVNKLHH